MSVQLEFLFEDIDLISPHECQIGGRLHHEAVRRVVPVHQHCQSLPIAESLGGHGSYEDNGCKHSLESTASQGQSKPKEAAHATIAAKLRQIARTS